MRTLIAVGCAATLAAASPAGAQVAESPLCEVGSSAVDLMYYESTSHDARIQPSTLAATIIFLKECPASVVRTFRSEGSRDPFQNQVPKLRQAWIAAAQSAARRPSNTEIRALLAAARAAVAQLGDSSLNGFLRGIFDGAVAGWNVDQRSLERLLARQALALLQDHTDCDGDGCNDASDNLLFLLGTHPSAVLRAMHADSVDANRWLGDVKDESFAGMYEWAEARESARLAVLNNLAKAQAAGLEREQRACEDTLRRIRYRTID